MKRIFCKVSVIVAVAVTIVGCLPQDNRLLPVVDAATTAPFLTAPGVYPTQLQAETAIEDAIAREGLRAVYTTFGLDDRDGAPAEVALFACRPGFFRPSTSSVQARRGFVHCHVDVGDAGGRLVGRATMSFYLDRGRWRLASVLEREREAR